MGTQRRLITWLAGLAVALLGATFRRARRPGAWRVAGKGGGEVTLLGSMHVLRASDYPLPESVDALYARSELLVLELDLDDLPATTLQSTLLGAAMLPPGTVLRDVLDADVYRLAEPRSASSAWTSACCERSSRGSSQSRCSIKACGGSASRRSAASSSS